MSQPYNAVIIGGGPAGATTALAVLHSNPDARVLIVDKETFPRDKVCGDGLGPAVATVLETLDASDVLAGHSPIDSVMVFGPRGASFRSALPEIDGREARGYVIPRQEFDDKLLHAAVAAGAETALGWRFVSTTLLSDERQVVIARGEERRHLTTEVLIGADGANSRVRKAFGVPRNPKQHTSIALRAYATSSFRDSHGSTVLFDFNEDLLPAYAWLFPMDGEHVNLGIGMPLLAFQSSAQRLTDLLADFISSLEDKHIHVESVQQERTHLLPDAGHLPPLAHDRGALIGDAASMINPFSGEGIAYGMSAAVLLAEAIALEPDYGSHDGLRRYEREFRRLYGMHYRSNRVLQRAVRSPRLANMLVSAARNDDNLTRDIALLLFGREVIHVRAVVAVARFMLSGKRSTED